MTISTNTDYVRPTYVPAQQIAQVGAGAYQASELSNATYIYFDCRKGSQFGVTMTSAISGAAVEAINPQPGQKIDIYLTQDGTGSYTVSWDSWIWPAKTAPTLSTTASSVDRISGEWNDSLAKWVGSSSLNLG